MHYIGIANRNHKSRWQLEAHGGHAQELSAAATKRQLGEELDPTLDTPPGTGRVGEIKGWLPSVVLGWESGERWGFVDGT
jgi:hypothetical protein